MVCLLHQNLRLRKRFLRRVSSFEAFAPLFQFEKSLARAFWSVCRWEKDKCGAKKGLKPLQCCSHRSDSSSMPPASASVPPFPYIILLWYVAPFFCPSSHLSCRLQQRPAGCLTVCKRPIGNNNSLFGESYSHNTALDTLNNCRSYLFSKAPTHTWTFYTNTGSQCNCPFVLRALKERYSN